MVKIMKLMFTSFKRTHTYTAMFSSTLQQATAGPHFCRRLLDSHRQVSVSCGVTAPFSWVLMCTRFCLCPPRVGSLQGWTFSFHASHIIRPAGCMGLFLDFFFTDPSIFKSQIIRLYHLLLELSSIICFPFIRDIFFPSLKILAPGLFSKSSCKFEVQISVDYFYSELIWRW